MSMGGGGQKTVQTTTQELAPEQRELLKFVIPEAKQFIQNPPQQYQGSGIAGFTPLQQQAQQMTLNAANNIGQVTGNLPGQVQGSIGGLGGTATQAQNQSQNVFPTLNPTINWAAQGAGNTAGQVAQGINQGNQATAPGLGFLTNPMNIMGNPYLQQATQAAIDPLIQQFQNQVLPGIASDAITAGGYGGTRMQIAQGLAAQGLQRETGNIAANMYSNAYGQGLGAMNQGLQTQVAQQGQNLQSLINSGQLTQQAAQNIMSAQLGGFGAQNAANQTAQQGLAGQISGYAQLPQMLQSTLLPAQLTSAVGEQQQAMQQALLSEKVQKYINEQLIPFAAAQDVAALAFGIPGGQTNSTAQTSGGGGAGIMPFLQGGLGLMGMLPMLFGLSDRRVKQNIKPVGKLVDGLGVYSFSYTFAPGAEAIGLMADEVKEKYPYAVSEDAEGILGVRYDLVPTWEGGESFRKAA